MIEKRMSPRLLRSLITYAILILYVLIPVLDSTVCADCLGHVPLQGETTISRLQVLYDGSYTSHEGTQSKTPGEQHAKYLCSICSNSPLEVEVSAPNLYLAVSPYDGPSAVPALSESHYSINKPPQNLLV